jgi:hypothetical protein
MAESFQWPNYGAQTVTIPANSISQPAMITTPGSNYQKQLPVRIDFGSEHHVAAGVGYVISGTGIVGMDGVQFYLWPMSKTQVELYTDANLTSPYFYRPDPFFGEGGAGVAWVGNNTAGQAAMPTDVMLTTVGATLNIGPVINPAVETSTQTAVAYRRTIGGLNL